MNILAVLPFEGTTVLAFAIIMVVFMFLSFYTKRKIFSLLAGLLALQIGLSLSDEVILLITMLGLTMFMVYDTLWGDV